MSRQQLSPESTSSRPLGNLELFFKTLSDAGRPLNREHWTIHAALQLRFQSSLVDPIPLLRRSWEILRYQYPALGATITHDKRESTHGRPHLKAETSNAHTWINDTFIVSHDCDSASSLFSTLLSTATATCYWIPRSSEFVIRSSHWRIDGVGMAFLCHDFMKALGWVIRQGLETPVEDCTALFNKPPSIAPNLELLAHAQSQLAPVAVDTESPVLAAGADALVAEFLRGIPSIGLPTIADSSGAIPCASSRVGTRLSRELTTRFTAACRGKSIKVSSAVHAAIVCVTAGFPQDPRCKSYAAFAPVDLRRSLETTATTETSDIPKVVGLYFSGLPVRVDEVAGKDFDTISRGLNSTYSRDLLEFWGPADGQGRKVSLLDLAEPYVRRTTALFNAPISNDLPPVQTPDLSSLGKLESFLQTNYENITGENLEVANFWIGTEMLNRCVQFHTWSWKGEFNLGASFNQSFYEKQFVVDVLEKVVHKLLKGCDVE
ncbi:hypothetical protein JX265_009967 [Neoarthrinium moseri]|uniref:Uncharacterized protein n=1 Tax=Neoarthrinium moseri TaxID=1658444 RepID=A0A9Q0AL90_9PEZI|nr:hypothetical protein JX265_009967 [Neoarthrinium moseri]